MTWSIAQFTERDREQKKKNALTKPRGLVQEPLERIGRWFRAPSSAFFAALVAAAARGVAADTEVDASRETLQKYLRSLRIFQLCKCV